MMTEEGFAPEEGRGLIRGDQVVQTFGDSDGKLNWPPCKPILYHNIAAEIPHHLQSLVKFAYTSWYALILVYIWNCVALGSVLFTIGDFENILGFILSIIYILVGPIVGFFIYRLLYNAAKTAKGSLYMLYMCFFSLEILLFIFFAVGVAETGGSGFILMIDSFDDGFHITAIFQLVACLAWLGMAAAGIITWISTKRAFSTSGGTGGLKSEATGEVSRALYENREEIAKQAWENRETAYRVAVENPNIVTSIARQASPNVVRHSTGDEVPKEFLS